MGILQSLREKFQKALDKNRERQEFLELVERETLPIKRKAYLEAKKKQAFQEGKEIAEKELLSKKDKTRADFGINTDAYFTNLEQKKKKEVK